jgi:protein-arginine deiminase
MSWAKFRVMGRTPPLVLGVILGTALPPATTGPAWATADDAPHGPVVIEIPARDHPAGNVAGTNGTGDGSRGGADRPVLVVLANRDDDDGDGVPDADDDRVNGPADELDLAALHVRIRDPRAARLVITSGGAPLRFFERRGAGWRHAGLQEAVVPVTTDPGGATVMTLHVEARGWAGLDGWDGIARIEVEAQDAAGGRLGGDSVACRVAPVLLRPATARATGVFVATGRYDNDAFVAALTAAVEPLALPLVVHGATEWREMWMQDAFEIATAAISGRRMHVVLAGLRDCDRFPDTLLAPGTAVARVAAPRDLAGGDAWADWYGNLEVSPPLAAHPHGRVIYGRNIRTGASFHPEVVRFLEAQGAQDPLWIDTSWLAIKHVDEIVAFLPGSDGRGVLVVPDPEEGLRLRGGGGPVDGAADVVDTNRRIARIIEAMLAGGGEPSRAGDTRADSAAGGLLGLLGWDHDRVVRVPLAFRVPATGLDAAGNPTDAVPIWSNPVNAVFLNGTVICGAADMPAAVRDVCRQRFHAAGAREVVFIDDAPYHRRGGNVHCATNTSRE